MRKCPSCGKINAGNDGFCMNCGKPLEAVGTAENLMSTGKDFAGKVASGAKKAVNQVSQKVEKEKEKINKDIERASQPGKAQPKDMKKGSGAEYMSKTELWSWLKKQSTRQRYFTEEKSELSIAEFMNRVNKRLKENEVPAVIAVKKVQWDRSNVSRDQCYVVPRTNVANPLTRLIHFEHIGKFTFVEEKTFITPPNLPEYPKNKLGISSMIQHWWVFLLVGAFLVLAGLSTFLTGGPVIMVIGIVVAVFGIFNYWRYQAINKHNRLCVQQEKAWNDAWANWHETIFAYSFQEDINGRLSRIFDAVSACVKQVSDEEFKNIVAVVKEEETSKGQMEADIERQMEEIMKSSREEYK